MAETVQRYNAGTQRAKGLLEVASALYDTSLSHETVRPGLRQTDSRVGTRIAVELGAIPGRMADAVSVSFRAGGFRAALEAVAGRWTWRSLPGTTPKRRSTCRCTPARSASIATAAT